MAQVISAVVQWVVITRVYVVSELCQIREPDFRSEPLPGLLLDPEAALSSYQDAPYLNLPWAPARPSDQWLEKPQEGYDAGKVPDAPAYQE
jgi:hypothetical protein